MIKYIGKIVWLEGDYNVEVSPCSVGKADITRAILNDDVLKIDHKNEGYMPDSEIRLRSKDGFSYEGSMKYMYDRKASAIVNLKMYKNGLNAILIGKWIEESVVYTCIIELEEVKEFKD